MARKLIRTYFVADREAKVYRDAEWNEFVVVFHDHSAVSESDYHTDDRDDAMSTALTWAWAETLVGRVKHGESDRRLVLQRVLDFAMENGQNWKDGLMSHWLAGTDANLPGGPLLRRARNYLGPRWLKGVTLDQLQEDIAR